MTDAVEAARAAPSTATSAATSPAMSSTQSTATPQSMSAATSSDGGRRAWWTRLRRRHAFLVWLTFALVLAAFVQGALLEALRNWDVGNADQSGFLRLALKIHGGDGFSNARYNPLLPFLLQPVASHGWSFFTSAKMVNIAIGALGLAALFVLGRRLFSPGPAILATALMAWNHEFITRAARTEPEVLLTGLFFAAWAVWTLGLTAAHHRQGLQRLALSGVAGALAGLAYLAKGSGQFLLIGFVFVGLAWPRKWRPPRREAALAAGAYLLVALPLLVSNTQEFGSPFYAFPSAHAMWYDRWDDRYLSSDGAQATASTYFASHSPEQIAQRVVDGAVSLPKMWAGALALEAPAPIGWGLFGLMAVLAGLGAALGRARPAGSGQVEDGSRPADGGHLEDQVLPTDGGSQPSGIVPGGAKRPLVLALATFAVLFVPTYFFFGWYLPISTSPRYELPMVPIVYLLLSAAAWTTLTRLFGERDGADSRTHAMVGDVAERTTLLCCGAVALVAVFALATRDWTSLAQITASDRDQNAATVAITDWLASHATPQSTVIWGPGDLATWPLYGLVSFEPIPSTATDWTALEALIRDEQATQVLLAPDMVTKRKEVLGPYFSATEQTVDFSGLPAGWRLVAGYPEAASGCRYCLFAVTRPPTP